MKHRDQKTTCWLIPAVLLVFGCTSSKPAEVLPTQQAPRGAASAASAPIDLGEQIRTVVEQYFNSYMEADLDHMLATLYPGGPMYPQEAAINQLRDTARGHVVPGEAKASGVKVIEISDTTASASMTLSMRADVQRQSDAPKKDNRNNNCQSDR